MTKEYFLPKFLGRLARNPQLKLANLTFFSNVSGRGSKSQKIIQTMLVISCKAVRTILNYFPSRSQLIEYIDPSFRDFFKKTRESHYPFKKKNFFY